MSLLQLVLIGSACFGLILAVVIEVRRGRKEDRLWQNIISNQQVLELDLY